MIFVLGGLHPGYSQLRDFISELGAREAPYAAVMNYVGIALAGALVAGFSVALHRAATPGPLAFAGAGSLALSGVAFIAVGLLPCDPGCSLAAPSPTMRMHVLAGMVAMATQALAPLAFGLRVLSGTGGRQYAAVSLALGLVALAATALLFAQGARLTYPGLVQKVAQAAASLWVQVSAIYVLRWWPLDGAASL